MNTTLPSVQYNCKKARKIVSYKQSVAKYDKNHANRRYRRFLSSKTRGFTKDVELFDNEPFSAPSLSSWDIC